MVQDIQINVNKDESYRDESSLDINVTQENPWDPLSKVFKMYRHTIQYSDSRAYVPSNYNISVYDKDTYYYKFKYNNPNDKVLDVEIYFKVSDVIKTTDPLILGFIHEDKSKCYYTYTHLTRTRNWSGSIGPDGVIKEQDLVARLLEEIGNSINRPNKLVIRLDERPNGVGGGGGGGRDKYPESGYYYNNDKKLVTVKKEESRLAGYDKYEHTVPSGISGGVTELYVSYENNSRFLKTASGSWLGSGKVTAYFDTSTKKLVLIVFSVTGTRGAYVYKYSDFVSELRKVTADKATDGTTVKTINTLESVGTKGNYTDSDLKDRLEDEREKLKEAITFVEEGGDNTNENISEELGNVGEGKFTKVILKPNTNDAKKGSSVGPWKVYKNQLFNHESGIKNPEGFLISIFTGTVTDSNSKKYKTITVFYALTDDCDCDIDIDCGCDCEWKALLVEFDPGSSGDKKYFKRTNKGGTTWADATVDIGGSTVDNAKLTDIAREASIIVDSKPSPGGASSPGDSTAATVGKAFGSIAGVGSVGAGVGYAIYKNFAAVSAFIGRLL